MSLTFSFFKGGVNVFFKKIVTFILAFSSVSAFAAPEVNQTVLASEQGRSIELNYKIQEDKFIDTCYKCTLYRRAKNVNVTIRGNELNSGSKVRVVVISKRFSVYHPNHYSQTTQELDLSYVQDGQFYAEIPNDLLVSGAAYGGAESIETELAVVVNGEWQVDPINKTSNFKVQFAK
jgi:hypothetical protein